MAKVVLILLCAICSTINAMENVSGQGQQPYLFIRNGSNWVISVFWQTADERNFNTVVNAQKSEKLDTLASIEKLEICAYGKYWGYLAKRYGIPLPPIKEMQGANDGYVYIDVSRWTQSWIFEYGKKKFYQDKEVIPETLKEALPGVERVHSGQPILAHHILNIDPSNVTEEILRNSFARLLARWELARFGFHETVVKVTLKLHEAFAALKRELIESSEHKEFTTFNPVEFQ